MSRIKVLVTPRTKKLLEELKTWCDAKHGRRAELAHLLGLPRQTVTELLNGRQNPTGEQILTIHEIWDDFRS